MKRILLAATAMAVVTAACGGGNGGHENMNMEGSTGTTAAPGAAAARTVDVTMIDIAYEPKTLKVQRGERIELVFHNQGKIAHDGYIGDAAAQEKHEKEMREATGGSMGHMGGETNAITVEPGQTGRLAYTFDKPGAIEIGCHQPDHYTAGMKIAVTVT
jgi:uncharacterized cupredoxin-like copper-binding protein